MPNPIECSAHNLDRLATLHIRPRNWNKGIILSQLYDAVRAKTDKPLCLLAAEALMKNVGRKDNVVIGSGFYLPGWLEGGANDGPPAAASLSRAINLGLKANSVVVTEAPLVNSTKVTCGGALLRLLPTDLLAKYPGATSVESFPVDRDEAQQRAREMLDQLNPKAVITVERVGPNEKGVFHTLLGKDITATTAKIDVLVEEAKKRGIVTIGVPDWGNDIGMGVIKDTAKSLIPYGAKCQCPCGAGVAAATSTDVTVVASVANFGAYAISACLALMLGRADVLQSGEIERNMIMQNLSAGGRDATAAPLLAVDGVPVDTYVKIVDIFNALVQQGLTDVEIARP